MDDIKGLDEVPENVHEIEIYGHLFDMDRLQSYFTVLNGIKGEHNPAVMTRDFIENCAEQAIRRNVSETKADEKMLVKELRRILYADSPVTVDYELAIPVYALVDCLGGTSSLRDSFVYLRSMDFFLYLVQYTINENLARRILRNLFLFDEYTDKIGPVNAIMFPLYCDALFPDQIPALFKFLEQDKTPDGIANYAYILKNVYGRTQGDQIYLQNWETNGDTHSLNCYVRALIDRNETKELSKWLKILGENTEDSMTMNTIGLIRAKHDKEKAQEIFWENWERNENSESLHNYAEIVFGKNTQQDLQYARQLFKENWEKNGNPNSLRRYIEMIDTGRGGHRDPMQVSRLQLSLKRYPH